MKSSRENLTRGEILGSGDRSPDQDIFSASRKQWWQRLGYCSILATVPAMLVSQAPVAHADKPKQSKVSVAGRARPFEKLNKNPSSPDLLKRQSRFLLPHQVGALAVPGGPDDCPGQSIPGGNYPAGAPYINHGDTTGANDTVTGISSYYYYYYYYSAATHGPDHVYSFALTSLGPNPKIEVSTTSSTYKPLIYVLSSPHGVCPTGTGNFNIKFWSTNDSRGRTDNIATLEGWRMNLPLNVPLYLFIDSKFDDASGAGPYTIRMQDVTIAPLASPNVIDDTEFFVRQQYLDFLNRPADADGLAFWKNQVTSCGGDQACIETNRINDSGAFFLSIEFQETGYLAYRGYKAAYGNLPNTPVPIRFNEFQQESQLLGQNLIVKQPGWEQILESNKVAFVLNLVQTPRFINAFPLSMTPAEFVDNLFANAGVTPTTSEREEAINEFAGAALTGDVAARALSFRRVAENPTLVQQEFNRAFVLMQYFGYLRRNPNDAPDGNFNGYNFWLDKLNKFNGDFNQAEMVKAFISSTEYRRRFGS
jgi:hypothetical protein